MAAVESWPDWTASVTSIKKLDPGPLSIGSRARVSQPKLMPAVWTVTEIDAGRSFSWVSRTPGVRVTGIHRVEPSTIGCRVTLSVKFEGLLAGIAARIFRKLNEEYLQLEATGLKRRCESQHRQ